MADGIHTSIDDNRLGIGQMGAENAQGFGIKVVGAVTQIVGKTEDSALVGNEDVTTGTIEDNALAAQVAQSCLIINLTHGKSASRHCH